MATKEVVVLFGGASGERRVSVASAQHVVQVMDEAEAWFVSPAGSVHRVSPAVLTQHARVFETDFDPGSAPDHPSLDAALEASRGSARVFLLAFHGGAGEDGTVQRALEQRGLAFTGSASVASERAFDKAQAKQIARAAGITIADSMVLPAGDAEAARAALRELLARHGRVVAKPVADGSSVGLHHVHVASEVDAVAEAVARAGQQYLAEAFIEGPELTVGVVDGAEGPRALPASEVRLAPGRVFDFDGKYLGRGTIELTPAEVAPEVAQAAQALALAAHRALGCEGYTRTDVIVGAQGPVFIETNTLPGLTRASFLPQQLAAEGTSMRAFLEGQLVLARRRRDAAR